METTIEKTKMRTSDLLKELSDESKREELLRGILDHQIVALGFDDIQSLLADDGIVIRSIGGGDTCQAAIDDALSAPQLQGCDIYKADKLLTTISFRNRDLDMEWMDTTEAINSFFDKFETNQTMIKWGLSCHLEQSQEFVINVWVVIAVSLK